MESDTRKALSLIVLVVTIAMVLFGCVLGAPLMAFTGFFGGAIAGLIIAIDYVAEETRDD